MDYIDAASIMAGRSRLEGSGARHVTNAHAVTGTAMADSSDGTVLVDLGGDVTTGDGSQWVEVQTDAHVLEGDQVDVLLVGEAGRGMSPVIYGVPGGGDRMAASVSNAETLAQQAEAEVEQVRQDVADFRDDVATTYATKVEREDGDDAVRTFITTNYTNSNDLATTYATKTLVSQTKDAIELAASQTYETQSDAAATYATKSALTVGLDGIRSEVAEDYQPKGDYATTASMNSAIQQSASSIESSVAATYETKSDAAATYATKTEVQQTASGLDTRITTAQSTADGAYLERTATGTTIDTTGAATIRSLVVEGQSVQDGTPTPSSPVEIQSVESRNILQITASQQNINGTTFTPQDDGSVIVNGTPSPAAYYKYASITLAAGTYAFSGYVGGALVTTTTHCRIYIHVPSHNISTNSGTSFTLTQSAEANVYIQAYVNQAYNAEVFRIQLELGSTAHPYQPYGCVTLVAGSTRTDIDLQGHALRSLPDGTHDELRVGERKVLGKRVGVVDLGTLTWTYSANGYFNSTYLSPAAETLATQWIVPNALCTSYIPKEKFYVINPELGVDGSFVVFDDTVRVRDSRYTDATAFTAAVSGVKMIYQLATPQTISLGTIDLPAPADTLWLDAALVPTIDATWWTVGGIAGQQALDAEVTERQTLIRQFIGGVLAGYVGNAIAALVNAAGSFDVVRTAWSGGVPSILGTLARYAASGISLFDAAGNVLAEFASDHVRIGGDVPDGTGVESAVQFFDQTETHDTDMTASTYFDGASDYQTMQSTVNLSSTLADEGKAIDTGSSGTAALDLVNMLENGISDAGEQHNEVHAALVADASYSDGATTSHAAVRATASTLNGSNLSYAELIADAIGIGPSEGAIDYTSMRQALVGLRHPSATYTPAVGTWTNGHPNAWEIAGYSTDVAETGNFTGYIDTANKGVGEFVALVGCTVRVAACVTWVDSVAGRRSVGAFVNATRSGTTLSGGTEYSNSGLFYTGSNAKTAQLTPLILHLAAGNRLNFGKYAPASAIQSNQTYKMNWVTIEVLSVD